MHVVAQVAQSDLGVDAPLSDAAHSGTASIWMERSRPSRRRVLMAGVLWMAIPGIRPLIATVVSMKLGDARAFHNETEFAA